MYLGLGLRVGGARSEQIIGITTGAYLDVDSLIVGLVLQDSFVSGTYPDFKGNTVTETVTGWYVNGVLLTGPDATSYTLQSGDDIGQAQITLSASGANNRIYYSGIESIVDYSHVQGDITYEVPIGGGSVPDAFVLANWSIADDGTNGDATVTITTLPADNGSAITDLEYRIGTGAAVSWGATSTGTYGISGLPDDTATNIQIRALNANGAGAWSDTKSVTTTGIPDAFTAGMWTLTDLASGGDARIAISSLPDDTGSAITDLEYKKDAGSWTSLSGTTTGNYDLTDVFTDGVSADVLIRAVNANGSGADSDTKSVTTTTADVTAPTLSSPTDAANGSTAATGSVSTNEGNGTLYWVVSTSGTAPSAAQVKAGQMHTGAAAADSGSQSVSGTGVQTLSPAPSGLTASTAYTIHFMHEDAAANQSSVASGDGFTTGAAAAPPTYFSRTVATPSFSGTSVSWPASHALDDVALLLLSSQGTEPATQDLSSLGWTSLGLVSESGADTSGHRQIRAWWKRATSTSEPAVAMNDTGQINAPTIFVIRGCRTSGAPVALLDQAFGATASGSMTVPSANTTGPNRFVLGFFTLALDSTTTQVTGYSGSNLASFTQRLSNNSQASIGIGQYSFDGTLASAGATGATVATTLTDGVNFVSALFEFIP